MRKHLISILQGTICGVLVILIVFLWRKGWNLLLGLMKEMPYQEIALGTIVSLLILILLQTFYILHSINEFVSIYAEEGVLFAKVVFSIHTEHVPSVSSGVVICRLIDIGSSTQDEDPARLADRLKLSYESGTLSEQ